MNAKLNHFSELSNFLSEKSSVCNDFLLLLDRFKLGHSLRKLKMKTEKGAPAWKVLAESMTMSLRRVHLDTNCYCLPLPTRRVPCHLNSPFMQKRERRRTSVSQRNSSRTDSPRSVAMMTA